MTEIPNLLKQAIESARAGRKEEARDMLVHLVESDPYNEMAWIWLSGLVDSVEDKIIACENALTINPANERVRAYLNQLQGQQKLPVPAGSQKASTEQPSVPRIPSGSIAREELPNLQIPQHPIPASMKPLDLARQYEAEGKYDEAIKIYSEEASHTKDSIEFNRLYHQIIRLEGVRAEKIAHVSPATTVARMSFGWPLLYLVLALVQMGLNPFKGDTWYLWLGLPIVAVGGFLLSLAEVRSRHTFWKKVFAEQSEAGSNMARMSASVGGWILVLAPHLLMLADSIARLERFQPPGFPF